MSQRKRIPADPRWLLWAAFLVASCSENFGTPPIPPGSTIAVPAEGFVGPVPARAVVFLRAVGGDLWVATDGGIFGASDVRGDTRWDPLHAGLEVNPGEMEVRTPSHLSVDPAGAIAIHAAATGTESALVVSTDGGKSYRPLPLPNLLAGPVQAVLALPPGPGRPDGSFVVAQGPTLAFVEAGDTDWTYATLPGVVDEFGVLNGVASGAVAVSARNGTAWRVWRGNDASMLADPGRSFPSRPLDVLPVGDGLAVATAEGIEVDGDLLWPGAGESILAADLAVFHGVARLAALVATPSRVVRSGSLDGSRVDPEVVAPPNAVPSTLAVAAAGVWIADTTGGIWWLANGSASWVAFGGAELKWSAVTADAGSTGDVALVNRVGSAIYFGDPALPMTQTDIPLFASETRALLPDPVSRTGLYAGSFGAYFRLTPTSAWESRIDGQFSYLNQNFSGPVNVQVLALAPGSPGVLWLGAIQNDGPYRSLDGGRNWSRVHAGLGVPYSIPDEDGLPGVTQVRAFVFVDGGTWMAGFRGGVWRLDETDTWEQRNLGLPDASGAATDTCCFSPLERQVDVRDMVEVGASLLAATSWGVFRGDPLTGSWTPASDGITNRDVWALAPHPGRSGWVLAAVRGTPDNPDWLFLTRDGGDSWLPVASRLRARFADAVVWSDPDALEIVALLHRSGAWRMELDP